MGPVAGLYGALAIGIFGALAGNTRGIISGVNSDVSIVMALVVSEQTPTGAEPVLYSIRDSSDNCSGSAPSQSGPPQIAAPTYNSNWTGQCRLAMETLALPPLIRLVAPRPARGEPPVCSETSPLGPPSAKAWAHWPMVWASRSKARPTAAAVHPCASSQIARHRSRSRGVGARYIRRRTSASSMRHFSRNAPIFGMPHNPLSLPCQLPQSPPILPALGAGFTLVSV